MAWPDFQKTGTQCALRISWGVARGRQVILTHAVRPDPVEKMNRYRHVSTHTDSDGHGDVAVEHEALPTAALRRDVAAVCELLCTHSAEHNKTRNSHSKHVDR